ncbi:MAG: OmpH family outer membrane protein [Burkholderiales bacterium]
MLCAALAAPAVPALAAEIKIGFVDAERIRRESGPAQKAQKKLEKEFAERDKELQKVAKQVKDLQTSLEKDAVTLSESDKRNKEQELARLNREFQRVQREFREDLNLRKNEELATIIERADKAIKTIAEAEKFDLIVQEAVFRSSRIDITDKVIKALASEK